MFSTKKILTDAYNRHRICGLHIDLQQMFWAPRTQDAFAAVNKMAAALRVFDVPNLWVNKTDVIEAPSSVAEFNRLAYPPFRFKDVCPIDNEVVLPKRGSDVCYNSEHDYGKENTRYLINMEFDTFLIDGVYAVVCVQNSSIGLAREFSSINRPINIVFVTDGINIERSATEYTQGIQNTVGDMHNVRHITSDQAIETLQRLSAPTV